MKIPTNILAIAVLLTLAISLVSTLAAIWQYRQHKKSQEAIYTIKMEVREKLVIDSVFSSYESRHRSRLDSIGRAYQLRLDSVSILIDKLKQQSNVLQTNLQPVDSVLPVY